MRKKEMNYFAELSDNEQSNLLHDALSKCKKIKKINQGSRCGIMTILIKYQKT